MVKYAKPACRILLILALALALCLALPSPRAHAVEYTRNAALRDGDAYPGVYYAQAVAGDTNATVGIPSLAKETLNAPTLETPAIIMGAALPYETRTGPTDFEVLPGGTLYPPYSYFRYEILNEQGPDGSWHKKMSGFDGSYYIIRVDVSDLILNAEPHSWLHVKEEGNKALMVALVNETMKDGKAVFADAMGNKASSFSLDNDAIALKDAEGSDSAAPYVDVIVMSSGTLVAGADTGSTDPNVMTADFKLKFYVDKVGDYDPELVYDPNAAAPAAGEPTMAEKMMAKYYDESKAPGATVTAYTVKGSDLEIEIIHPGVSGGADEFWSLRRAMAWPAYNDTPIKMICEVPVLEGLLIDGTEGGYRHVIFDVNSFDIQIANHQDTGAAALTVKNAKLTVKDGFNTTGAELAIGNNARMSIQEGGILEIDETCQVEVEYDAASVTSGSETPAPELTSGLITIESGGEIVNNGVISIEGTEGKPIDPAAPAVRDMQAASIHVKAGGKLTNNGAFITYGSLYNMGTVVNNGRYADTITSNDPDKGQFTYHKGMQISWKDDVTQEGVRMGHFYNGDDQSANGNGASFVNNGDLVLAPGFLDNYGTLTNAASGDIYLCAVDEAVIPTGPRVWDPIVMEERIGFEYPVLVFFTNNEGGMVNNEGNILTARIAIVANGQTGALTPAAGDDLAYSIAVDSHGQLINSGVLNVDGVYNFAEMQNSGTVRGKVLIEATIDSEGSLSDTAGLTEVYNAAKSADGGTSTWTHVSCEALRISPSRQYALGGESVNWTLRADTAVPGAQDVRYLLEVYQGNSPVALKAYTVKANEDNEVVSPLLPHLNGNAVYSFLLLDGLQSVYGAASVQLSSTLLTPPAAVEGLVYSGKDQVLTTTGGKEGDSLLYRLGDDGAWGDTPPAAKDAGSYRVYYRLASEEVPADPAFVEAVIAKRPVTVSGNDAASRVGAELAELGWTVSGLAEGEALTGVSVITDADKDTVGTYAVTVNVADEFPNYAITVVPGKYSVTAESFAVVAKDKYGVFSDEATYKGFNIDLTVPEGATAYYSTATALTAENYQTDGVTALKNLPAAAGAHTVYYYVTNGVSSVSGSKQVIIEKAAQAAPDPAKLQTAPETWRNSGDGTISGLTARKMEYRLKGNDGSYSLAYDAKVYVMPGTYLVRLAADLNHYPSPDTELTVAEGETITVSFNSNGAAEIADATDLSCGDLVPRPVSDPTLPGLNFIGWFHEGKLFDFDTVVEDVMTLTAGFEPTEPFAFVLPTQTQTISASAFESVGAVAVEIPEGYTAIGPDAFKGCTSLRFIRIPKSVTTIDASAFDGCTQLYVFGAATGAAKDYCSAHSDSCFFIEDVTK